MLPVEFKQRKHHRDLKNPGDWCRTEPHGFLLLCPSCGQMIGCVSEIRSEIPFLIGVAIDDFNPCGHQFRIENGCWIRRIEELRQQRDEANQKFEFATKAAFDAAAVMAKENAGLRRRLREAGLE